MGSNKASAASLLRDVFGFDDFRPGQEEIVEAVARGENTLAIMPTGGGKSLCFQLPALMQDGVTVVISPLIALMRDQVRALQASGVAAGALTSGNSPEETEMVWNALQQRKLKLLYITPERLSAGSSLGMLRNIGVSMIAVDEAHCISQWGHDFRPDYLRIGELRRTLNVPLAAFTATADEESRVEIVEKLFDGVRPRTFLHGFDRPNIHLAFTVKNSPRTQILNFVNARKGQSGIIYCGTRAKTETLALGLREVGHASIYYHGGMDGEDRRIAERRFQQEDGLIVVATVAFGMGIDKPDIRWVAHADLPKSVESYYQEIGRAGRDGHPAETLTLFGPEDIKLRRSQIDEGLAPAERRMADHARLNALLGLAEALECRRKTLLNYFGETKVNCNHCDLCQNPPEVFDGTTAVRKALSAMLRTEERFGSGHLIDILLGNETEKIRQRAHTKLPTFGIGKEYTRVQWQTVFRQMMGHDLVRPDADRYGALRMTDAALPILRGLASIDLRRDTIKAAVRRPTVTSMLSEEQAPLLSALKAKRRGLAEVANVPAYIIFPDRTLIEMAERRPKNLDQMARVNGVGAKKLQNFGEAFLKVINNEVEPLHPTRRKLAGRKCGALFDKLMKVQTDLARGSDGTGKPLSCSASQLAKVAQLRPDDNVAIERVLGDRKAERFGSAFLDVLRNAG
ncbi:MAG: DNA helicase RecQ [Tateyamaria sp.]|nr:DNA helicase RecQ [Tateyamaria sp.]